MKHPADGSGLPVDEAIERAAQDVADGRAVDWAMLDGGAQDQDERERLECLRIIGAIAAVHQSIDDIHRHAERAAPLDPSQPPPKDAGEPWGRYQLLELVGSGNFGSVYRAWDPELEFEIAIKILHRHVADDRLSARLLSEGRALAKVRHANVVRVHGVQFHEGRVGLCMEYVRGETLETIMSRSRLSPREAVHVGQEICRALAAVHQAGFVHRDVTVRNVMRDLSGGIMLMDFGTGLRTSTNSAMNLAGTPMYMAPEVLAEEPASPRSDVYSIGVLLYHLVTGKFPVEGRTMNDLKAAHMLGRRTPLVERAPDLPIPFITVVEHALAANPQQRCASAGVLLHELAGALSVQTTRTQYVARVAAALTGSALLLTGLGAVTSRYFNYALGRSGFADEWIFQWLSFGWMAFFAPGVIFIFTVLAAGLLTVGLRFFSGSSATVGDLNAKALRTLRRLRLDEVSTLASWAFLLSAAGLAAAWRYFLPFLDSLALAATSPNISMAESANLAILSPDFHRYYLSYRATFIGVVIFCVAVWYPVIRLSARKGESINRLVLAAGSAVLVLALLFLVVPYRLFAAHQRDDFPAVEWHGDKCYVLGERADDLLLFCPGLTPPRNRTVNRNEPGIERLHIREDIFTNLAALK